MNIRLAQARVSRTLESVRLKFFPLFFFIHRFRCHSMYRIQPYMVPAVFSLVNDFFFFLFHLIPGKFSPAREKVEGTTAIATTTTRTMAMNLLLFPFPELWVKFLPEKQIQLLRVGFVPLTKAKVTSTRSRRLFPWLTRCPNILSILRHRNLL